MIINKIFRSVSNIIVIYCNNSLVYCIFRSILIVVVDYYLVIGLGD